MIITLEGVTQTGKSTLCNLISLELSRKYEVINLNHFLENDTLLSAVQAITHPKIHKIEPFEELLLYSVRLNRKCLIIDEFLVNSPNTIVIIDRFIHSIVSFFVGVRQMEAETVDFIVGKIVKNLVPDITFLIDIDLETINERTNGKPLSRKFENIDKYFSEYRNAFIYSLNKNCKNSKIIDGRASFEDIQKQIILQIEENYQ